MNLKQGQRMKITIIIVLLAYTVVCRTGVELIFEKVECDNFYSYSALWRHTFSVFHCAILIYYQGCNTFLYRNDTGMCKCIYNSHSSSTHLTVVNSAQCYTRQTNKGHVPKHVCNSLREPLSRYGINTSLNISDFHIEYEECQTQLYYNSSNGNTTTKYTLPCREGYSYDTSVGESIISEWNLVCDKKGVGELSQLLVMAGELVGAIVFSSLADNYGRKPVFVSSNILLFIFSLSLSFVPSFVMFAVFRFILGALQQGMDLSQIILCLEMFPQQYRGRIAAISQYCWTFFVVILSGIGYLMRSFSWRYVQILTSLTAIHSLACYWIVDESVRWLLVNNRLDDAVMLVKKIAKKNRVSLERFNMLMSSSEHTSDGTNEDSNKEATDQRQTNDIIKRVLKSLDFEKDQKKSSAKRNTCLDILKHGIMLKYSLILWFIWFVNSLTYFGLYLISTPLTGNRFLDFFLNGLAELPGAIFYTLLIDRIGRRQFSIALHTMTGVSLIISTLVYTYKGENQPLHVVSVILNYIGKMGVAASFALLFLYSTEIYPTNLRNIGLGICSASARIGGMIAPYSNLFASYVLWGPGVVFGVCCIVVALLILFLPETKGREFPQTIDDVANWRHGNTIKEVPTFKERTI